METTNKQIMADIMNYLIDERAEADSIANEGYNMQGSDTKPINSYPATDISFINETEDTDEILFIELAVPGFAREELSVTLVKNELIIKGNVKDNDKISDSIFTQKQINRESFIRKITVVSVYEDTQNISADLDNGILLVTLKPNANPKQSTNVEIR